MMRESRTDMKRRDVLKILKGLANKKPSEYFYFYLMKRTAQLNILKNQIPKYKKDNSILNLLKKFLKRFEELIVEFGWNENFSYILDFFKEMASLGIISKKKIKELENLVETSRNRIGFFGSF